ncbi:membrane protein [Mycolicibacterium madagascariense]|uniref:Membrane protein n=1 Tax=Mycolicibacterium madagascariense TaxID=212765 RepID=A0A7I7XNR8_9MYCO|nr:membrane protein [Mycolicibacterium madagascariense]
MLVALLLLVVPGAIIARTAQLTWPVAVALGPALTYGTVALAILPFGALGIPWNLLTAVVSLVVVTLAVAGLQAVLGRRATRPPAGHPITVGPALVVAAGVVLGAAFITFAAIRGMPHWQSIPSTWDAVWHANEIRFIVDTGQASPTHMGELRNVETHAALYYPSAFHALAAIQCELTGASATAAYTLNSLAASVWLFPVSAAALAWHLLRSRGVDQWRTAGSAAAAGALAASFTSVPYVEFDTASMPNLVAYGLAVPTMILVVSALRHRRRIPLAVLALLGVFSVHITGGVVTVLFVAGWWLFEGLWRPVRGRLADFLGLVAMGAPTLLLLLPQFVGVLQQAEIIAGHEFDTHQGKKRALFDAVVQHTRHLNDYPIQNALILLSAIGFVILLVRRMWWPAAVWLLLVYAIVHSSAPFGGLVGRVSALFTDLFYSDPRRLSGVVTLLLAPMAGIALFTIVWAALTGLRRVMPRLGARTGYVAAAVLVVAVSVGMAWHYFPRHRYLIGEKYDSVMIDDKDLQAFAYLESLPGARDTLIGNANVDGTAWMYAVAGLHPLWTHYDYPQQQGPGYHRFIFWAFADDADTDPRVAAAVHALNIRYVLTSTPVVRGFVMPDGLVSLDKSTSWKQIYDNGEDHIYEWQGK